MKQILTTNTFTYDMGKKWRMDIVVMPKKDYAEAWIYREDYGIKSLMFGSSYNQSTCRTLDYFIDMAYANFYDYKEIYEEEYMD